MTIKELVIFSLIFMVLALLFAACSATYQAYTGPEIARDKEAVIIVGKQMDRITGEADLQVDMIDGQHIEKPPKEIVLRPGDHSIEISGFVSSGIYKKRITPIQEIIYVEAGKSYRLFIDNPQNPTLVFTEEPD